MLPSFLLALREGLEAALVIGIVLSVLGKLGREDCARTVWLGVGGATLLCVGVALVLPALHWGLHGAAEPVSEGVTLFLAAGLLTWMIAWMNRQAGQVRREIEGRVREAVCSPGVGGVFALTFVAVAREGTELALFLAAAAVDSSGTRVLAGAALGVATAVGLAWLLFTTTTRLNLARFFQVTTALLVLFAAGLVAKGVHEFNEVGWIPAVIQPVWNSRALLDEHSFAGTAARTLLGYTSTPSLTAVVGYLLYVVAAIALFRIGTRRPREQAPAAAISSDRVAT
jgi:high-affinity iron transporter